MRLAFFVNDVATEVDEYTTTRLARAAAQRGHQVTYVGVEDVELGESDGQLLAWAHAAVFKKDDTLEGFMERIKEREAERIVMDDLDALFLRNSGPTHFGGRRDETRRLLKLRQHRMDMFKLHPDRPRDWRPTTRAHYLPHFALAAPMAWLEPDNENLTVADPATTSATLPVKRGPMSSPLANSPR
jgi:hypothetical protein